MKIKAVKLKKKPGYPDISWFVEHPDLLKRNVPARWITNRYAATALSAFVLCGCTDTIKKFNMPGIFMSASADTGKADQQIGNTGIDTAQIAPIFVHGDGSGATGCVVIAPPVFIPEDEACKIIFDRLTKEGLVVTINNNESFKFKSPQIAISCSSEEEINRQPKVEVEIGFDGYLKEQNIYIEYVSVDDFELFAEKDNLYGCSVTEYGTLQAAQKIREELVKTGTKNTVVFYDPISSFGFDENESWEQGQQKATEESKKLLTDQVEDFIKWLRKTGITK